MGPSGFTIPLRYAALSGKGKAKANEAMKEDEMRKHRKLDFRFTMRAWFCAAICILWLAVPATAQRPTIITYDAPGAGTAAGQGTFAGYVNDWGVITGWYVDSNGLSHGYIRYPHGGFASFDAPGATGGTWGIFPNNKGQIQGIYFDSVGMHGFVRSARGAITEFDFPNSPGGTYAQAFNDAGVVTGLGWDTNGLSHGFVRSPDGNFTEFDPPGLGTGCSGVFNFSCGTWPLSINSEGAITGYFVNSNGAVVGFVRAADGGMTEFENCANCAGYWINNAGEIVGQSNSNSFLRDRRGSITMFSVPGAGTTFGWAMNEANIVTGWWLDTNNASHGFVRAPDGRITKFDAPGAGTGAGQGTTPENINDAGTISGLYVDNSNVTHGFIRLP
jgi:hypothetical protein